MGRKPNVFSFPPPVLDVLFRAAGQREAFERLTGSMVADASSLMSLGWSPVVDTTLGLRMLMGQTQTLKPDLVFGSAASVRQ
jgi:hypothetical protein